LRDSNVEFTHFLFLLLLL